MLYLSGHKIHEEGLLSFVAADVLWLGAHSVPVYHAGRIYGHNALCLPSLLMFTTEPLLNMALWICVDNCQPTFITLHSLILINSKLMSLNSLLTPAVSTRLCMHV